MTLAKFVLYKKDSDDQKVGVVIRDDRCGGVFRGYCNLWFGESDTNGMPVLKSILASDCQEIPNGQIPLG